MTKAPALPLRATLPVASPVWSIRWQIIRRLARQEVMDALYGWPFYGVVAASLLADVLLLYNNLHFVADSGLQVLGRPFYVPLLLTATLAMLYVTAWAVLAIVRPRDQGSLRILFFAPVDGVSLIGGHFIAGLALYSLLMLAITPLLVLLGLLTNLPFSLLLLLGVVLSPLPVGVALAIGLCLSTIAPSSRSAMFFLLGTLLLLVVVQVGYTTLLSIPNTGHYYDAILFLRDLLRTARTALGWLSPSALLPLELDAAMRLSWRDLGQSLLTALAGCAVWLVLATMGLKRRGVLQ